MITELFPKNHLYWSFVKLHKRVYKFHKALFTTTAALPHIVYARGEYDVTKQSFHLNNLKDFVDLSFLQSIK